MTHLAIDTVTCEGITFKRMTFTITFFATTIEQLIVNPAISRCTTLQRIKKRHVFNERVKQLMNT